MSPFYANLQVMQTAPHVVIRHKMIHGVRTGKRAFISD
jgi:hypothetical protein